MIPTEFLRILSKPTRMVLCLLITSCLASAIHEHSKLFSFQQVRQSLIFFLSLLFRFKKFISALFEPGESILHSTLLCYGALQFLFFRWAEVYIRHVQDISLRLMLIGLNVTLKCTTLVLVPVKVFRSWNFIKTSILPPAFCASSLFCVTIVTVIVVATFLKLW